MPYQTTRGPRYLSLLRRGAQLGDCPGASMSIVPGTAACCLRQAQGPHATASGSPEPDRTRTDCQQAVQSVGCHPGPPSRLSQRGLCTADPASFRMRQPGMAFHPKSQPPQIGNKENTNTRPAPPSLFPRPFKKLCLRQSPSATFIEAPEAYTINTGFPPAATLVSHTLSPTGTEQRKRRFTGTTSLLEGNVDSPKNRTVQQRPRRVSRGR
ncbi:uncharacterized protein B0T15DRAFT_32475 [Chaetomium strumarium]|uniref:Uncharacterized protein n=1 Tax=Chaetomium strumarium TaxID=1170767 RepID=A0AAJ0H1V3_9PEZI|nr:hypothetical protein B0T15DRAFT_32475 [Chaetomium strumarium]